MAKNKSHEMFLRTLRNNYASVCSTFKQLVVIAVTENRDRKDKAANELLIALNHFQGGLDKVDYPTWLNEVINAVNIFVSKRNQGHDASETLKDILLYYHRISNWNPESVDTDEAIDLEELYRKYYEESRLPELFGDLVKLLNRIIASGAVNDVNRLNELIKLAATLHKNNKPGFFSTYINRQSLVIFAKHGAIEYLKAIPGLKPAATAIEKAVKEIKDKQCAALIDKVNKAIDNEFEKPQLMLESNEILGDFVVEEETPALEDHSKKSENENNTL